MRIKFACYPFLSKNHGGGSMIAMPMVLLPVVAGEDVMAGIKRQAVDSDSGLMCNPGIIESNVFIFLW